MLSQLKLILDKLFSIWLGRYQPTQLYFRAGFPSPAQVFFWTYRVFWKIWSKGNNALLPPDNAPPTSSPNINISMWEYFITILCTTAFVRFIRIISWVLTMWLISILPLYKAMKRVVFQFLIWKPSIVTQIFFSHCYCLLLIITQCSSLVYSLCSFGTIVMPFNFQPTIFSAKMQYNRPCKYSRPWAHQICPLSVYTPRRINGVLRYYFTKNKPSMYS